MAGGVGRRNTHLPPPPHTLTHVVDRQRSVTNVPWPVMRSVRRVWGLWCGGRGTDTLIVVGEKVMGE